MARLTLYIIDAEISPTVKDFCIQMIEGPHQLGGDNLSGGSLGINATLIHHIDSVTEAGGQTTL